MSCLICFFVNVMIVCAFLPWWFVPECGRRTMADVGSYKYANAHLRYAKGRRIPAIIRRMCDNAGDMQGNPCGLRKASGLTLGTCWLTPS